MNLLSEDSEPVTEPAKLDRACTYAVSQGERM